MKNPYIMMLKNPQDPSMFYGRNTEIEWLLQLISADQPSLCSVVGFKGIGKTFILNYLAHEEGALRNPKYNEYIGAKFRENPDKLISVYLDFSLSSESVAKCTEKRHMFWRLAKGLLERLNSKRYEIDISGFEAHIMNPQTDIFQALTNVLNEIAKRGFRVFFLMDNFDALKGRIRTQDLDKFLVLGQYASFVYASENPLDELDNELHNESFWLSVVAVNGFLDLMLEDEAKGLITGPAQSLGVHLLLSDAEFVLQAIGRHPYLIVLACEPIFERRKQGEYKTTDELSRGEKNLIITRVREQSEPFFSALWRRIAENEHEALFQLIQNETRPSSQLLRQLCRKSLIYYDEDGNPQFFSELFREFTALVYLEHQQSYREKMVFEKELPLTHRERLILDYLSARPNQFCSKEELLQEIWKEIKVSPHAVEVTIQRLRAKLNKTADQEIGEIDTERLKGYRYLPTKGEKWNV